jgi:hypothetical protein
MDPVTAFSLFCSVLDLVEKGVNYGIMLHKLYTDGQTDAQEGVQSNLANMDVVVAGLRKAESDAKSPGNEMDARIALVVARSATLCDTLGALLKKCKPKRQKSCGSAFAASIRILRYKSKIEDTQQKLEDCRTELNILFSATAQYVCLLYVQIYIRQITDAMLAAILPKSRLILRTPE